MGNKALKVRNLRRFHTHEPSGNLKKRPSNADVSLLSDECTLYITSFGTTRSLDEERREILTKINFKLEERRVRTYQVANTDIVFHSTDKCSNRFDVDAYDVRDAAHWIRVFTERKVQNLPDDRGWDLRSQAFSKLQDIFRGSLEEEQK